MEIEQFKQTVWQYYDANQRNLPWRYPNLRLVNGVLDPYTITVSEIMLQQTQVSRVVSKFQEFIALFPTVQSLAAATQDSVLRAWLGLGYNRRARYLHSLAKQVCLEYEGTFPSTAPELQKLPGIGINTAAAIMAYAYNQPVVFIETNIRSVFLYHFFKNRTDVSDSTLLPLITEALDQERPREWYWALMDYGSYLKSTTTNPSRKSRHHVKQSRFVGSRRQLRGEILRQLVSSPQSITNLREVISDERLDSVIESLKLEGFIEGDDQVLRLTK